MQKRKVLPHIDLAGYYQFVTFRTHDSLDDYITRVRAQEIESKKQEYIIDRYLDNSSKGAYLNGEVLTYLKGFLHSLDGDLYELVAFVVMPNHVHILFRQTDALNTTMQKIKGTSAFAINKMLDRKGKFWEKNYYDKIIRDASQFGIVYDYIKYNALKANLDDWEERFFGIYD
jgi:REP element-mobilizing transposase RayT